MCKKKSPLNVKTVKKHKLVELNQNYLSLCLCNFLCLLQWRPILNTSLEDYKKPQLSWNGPVSFRSETIPLCDHRPWWEVEGGLRDGRKVLGWAGIRKDDEEMDSSLSVCGKLEL